MVLEGQKVRRSLTGERLSPGEMYRQIRRSGKSTQKVVDSARRTRNEKTVLCKARFLNQRFVYTSLTGLSLPSLRLVGTLLSKKKSNFLFMIVPLNNHMVSHMPLITLDIGL